MLLVIYSLTRQSNEAHHSSHSLMRHIHQNLNSSQTTVVVRSPMQVEATMKITNKQKQDHHHQYSQWCAGIYLTPVSQTDRTKP